MIGSALKRGLGIIIGRGASSLVTLINYALIARILSVDDLGVLLVVVGLGQTLGAVVSLGVPDALIRILAEFEMNGAAKMARSAALRGGAIVVCAFGVLLGVCTLMPTNAWMARMSFSLTEHGLYLYAWGITGGHALLLLLSQSLVGIGRAEVGAALFYGSTPIALLVLLLPLWVTGYATIGAILACQIVALLFGAIVAAIVFLSETRKQEWITGQPSVRQYVSLGLPMMGTRVTIMLETWAPVWLAGLFMSPAGAASLGMAMRLLNGMTSITQIINFVSRGNLVRLATEFRRLESYVRTLASVVGIPIALGALCALLAGEEIMGLAFGSAYAQSGVLLGILSIAYAVQWLFGSPDMVLMMRGYHSRLFALNGVFVVATIPIMAVAAALGGPKAEAVAFTGGLALKFSILLYLVRQLFGFWALPTASFAVLRGGLAAFLDGAPAKLAAAKLRYKE